MQIDEAHLEALRACLQLYAAAGAVPSQVGCHGWVPEGGGGGHVPRVMASGGCACKAMAGHESPGEEEGGGRPAGIAMTRPPPPRASPRGQCCHLVAAVATSVHS